MSKWLSFGSRDDQGISKDTPIDSLRFVVLDTELTSLDRRTNRLLSVGALAMTGAKIHLGEQFYRIVNPQVTVPSSGVLVHRLRPEDIANGEPPEQVLRELTGFIKNAVLIGHFAEIDRDVLRKEYALAGLELKTSMVCTARLQRWIAQKSGYTEGQFHEIENLDLGTLAKQYGLEYRQAHHALDDAFLTARLWQRQKHLLESHGARALGQLLRIGKV